MAVKKSVLGRGLDALLGANSASMGEGTRAEKFPLDKLSPNPLQPRRTFDVTSLKELADSIAVHGLLQPLLVRREENGQGTIVAGERRWRAAKMAGLSEVPVRFIEADDRTLRELALVENLQRQDLKPLELAAAMHELCENFGLTQEELGKRLGWSRSAVTNKLRLLSLSERARQLLGEGTISEGHARALLSLPNIEEQNLVLDECLRYSWSVRALEKRVQVLLGRSEAPLPQRPKRWRPNIVSRIAKEMGISMSVSRLGDQHRVVLKGLDQAQVTALCHLMDREAASLTKKKTGDVEPGKTPQP